MEADIPPYVLGFINFDELQVGDAFEFVQRQPDVLAHLGNTLITIEEKDTFVCDTVSNPSRHHDRICQDQRAVFRHMPGGSQA